MLTCDLGVIGVFIKQKIAWTLQRVSGAGSGVAPPVEIPADQLPARNVVRAQVRACSLDSLIVCDVLMGWFVREFVILTCILATYRTSSSILHLELDW